MESEPENINPRSAPDKPDITVGDGPVWQKIGWIPGAGALLLTEFPADGIPGFELVGSIPGRGYIYLERFPADPEIIDLDAYGPCSIFECDHPELAYTPEELDRIRRSLAAIFEPEGEQ